MNNTAKSMPAMHGKNYQIAAYDKFREQLADMEKQNKSATFDYESKEGNAAARSHVAKLRRVKADIDRARKAEKEEVLERGRIIDTEAKELIAEVENMIALHQQHLDEIEAREAERVNQINARVLEIETYSTLALTREPSHVLEKALANVKAFNTETGFDEFAMKAEKVKRHAIEQLNIAIGQAKEREFEQAELIRLRQEAAEREASEASERQKREAAEKALKYEQEKAQRERDEAERKAAAEALAAERRENELKLAAERAERERLQAVEDERQRVAAEAARQADEDRKREESINHQKKIHGEIIKAMEKLNVSEAAAKAIIAAIRSNDIPHMKIIY